MAIQIITVVHLLTIPFSGYLEKLHLRASPEIFATDLHNSLIDMTSLPIRNVAVLGAGGSIGPAVLDALDLHFDVTIVTRKSSTSTFPSKFKRKIVADDYPATELLTVFQGQDAVVSLISPWVCEAQQPIIDVAVKAGVKRFIPAEFGYDTTNANAIALLPPLQARADIVKYLKAQEDKGLTWTAIITGPFFDWCIANGAMGFDLAKRKAMIYDNGDQAFSASTVALIGCAVARTLLQPEAPQNRYIYVSSFTTTQNEILSILEKYSNGHWEVTRVNSKSKIEEARKEIEAGGDVAAASRILIMAIQYTAGNGADFSGRDSNKALALQKENMEDILKGLLKAE